MVNLELKVPKVTRVTEVLKACPAPAANEAFLVPWAQRATSVPAASTASAGLLDPP